ncbi:hypothetical protein NpPPO83_00007783 [Neofusicoccum parvum]|uniref:Uncharacterized protein n=1 Tax=Neofusicoccum parvum TaxID=310453 RepID=A0ACB5SE77_9PEZI|nr:hypothetical protein NpPPO83_00007783 [Neofusicoccum parvum]
MPFNILNTSAGADKAPSNNNGGIPSASLHDHHQPSVPYEERIRSPRPTPLDASKDTMKTGATGGDSLEKSGMVQK